MSILSLGRRHEEVDASRERWWNRNPARPKVVAAPVEATPTHSWWRWNPYRQDAGLQNSGPIDRQGRRQGYAKGVRDEHRVMARRQRRSRHPILGFAMLVAACAGVGFLGLAYETGSFAGGGAVIDQQLADWRADVMGAAGRAGDQGGHAVQTVGQTISSKSQQLSQNGG